MKKTDLNPFLQGKNIPFEWKQRITLSENKNIINYKWYRAEFIAWLPIFQKWLFTEYKDNFLFLDYLILGDNPLLNTILIQKIFNKAIIEKKHFIIGFIKPNDFDYFGYHHFFYRNKKQLYPIKNFLDTQHYNIEKYLTILNIKNTFDISYHRKFIDNKKYCFFLSEKKQYENPIEKQMPTFVNIQNKIKNLISQELNINSISKIEKNIIFPNPNKNHYNYIISNKVFVTSYQKDFNYSSEKIKINHNNVSYNTTLLHHEFEKNSFGSALYQPCDFFDLEFFAQNDLQNIKTFDINQ